MVACFVIGIVGISCYGEVGRDWELKFWMFCYFCEVGFFVVKEIFYFLVFVGLVVIKMVDELLVYVDLFCYDDLF